MNTCPDNNNINILQHDFVCVRSRFLLVKDLPDSTYSDSLHRLNTTEISLLLNRWELHRVVFINGRLHPLVAVTQQSLGTQSGFGQVKLFYLNKILQV